MNHLDIEIILAGLEGKLDREQVTAMQSHMATCEQCGKTFRDYASLLDGLSRTALQDAPEAALGKAFSIFKAPAPAPKKSIIEVIRDFAHDSWADVAAMGLRGEQSVRQVGMSATHHDLHISIDYLNSVIRGQLLAKSAEDFSPAIRVRLMSAEGSELDASDANDFGEFEVNNVVANATLLMELENGSILQFQVPESI